MGSRKSSAALALFALQGLLVACDPSQRSFAVNPLGAGDAAAGSATGAPSTSQSGVQASSATGSNTALISAPQGSETQGSGSATQPATDAGFSSDASTSSFLPDASLSSNPTASNAGTTAIPTNSAASSPPDGSASATLGTSCGGDEECASQHCVAGICCDSACNGVCSSCALPSLEGTCSALESDEACPAIQCPDDSACREFNPPSGGNCAGVGECRTDVLCDSTDHDVTTACANGEGLCDGVGTCFVPDKLSLGEACESDDDCAEAECVSAAAGGKICCDSACNGTCQACGSDGHCDQAPADDNACSAITCPADTSCTTYPNDLSSNRCVGFGQCATTQSYCQPNYRNDGYSCGSGLECNGGGGCYSVCSSNQAWCTDHCVNPLTDNAHCGVNSACSGGSTCSGNTACENGSCLVQCSASQARCNNTCIDPVVDVLHCGASGSCAGSQAGAVCAATGACVQSNCRDWKGGSAAWDAVNANSSPKLFAATNGDIYATWQKYENNFQNIYHARYNASTHQWGAGERVETDDAFANGSLPAVDGQGTQLAVWFQDVGVDSKSVIRTSSRSSQGTWGAPTNLSSTSQIAMWPLMTVLSSGEVLVVWSQRPDPSGSDDVYFARRTTNGWLQAQNVETMTGSSQIQALIPDAKGGAMAVWVNYPLGGGNSLVYASRWNGSSWGTATKLADSADTKLYQTGAADANGNYYIAWTRFASAGYVTEYSRYDQAGTWSSSSISTGGSFLSVVVTPSGTPYFAWYGSSGTEWTRLDPSSGQWQLPQPFGNDNVGILKTDSKGNIFAVYRENDKLLWRYLPIGAAQFTSAQPIMDTQNYVFDFSLVVSGDGRAMVSFTEGPGNGSATQGFDRFE